jgi:glycosyltransferase involved in cell wall biosynthesis
MLDALAAGVPIIAADSPAARQCIRPNENGSIYPLGDAQSLASAVLGLIEQQQAAAAINAKASTLQTAQCEAAAYLALVERLRSS